MTKVKFNIAGIEVEMDKAEVNQAMESGEVVTINHDSIIAKSENSIIYTPEELEARDTELKNTEYKSAKKKAIEMAVKDGREKYGLDFEGKTLDNFAESLKAKTLQEAKVEPNKKITDLQSDNDKLRENYATLEAEFTGFKSNIEKKSERSKLDGLLMDAMPGEGLTVSKKIALLALKEEGQVDFTKTDEGINALTFKGEIQKDSKTLQPIDPNPFVNQKLLELGLIKAASGGTGAKDDTGATADSYDKFVKDMEANNIHEGSVEFNKKMNAEINAGTLKI